MQPNSGGSKKKVCAAFSRGGSCAFGDKCKNAHTRDSGGSTPRNRRGPKAKQESGSRKASTPAPAQATAPASAFARVPNQPPSTFTPSVASRSPTPPDLDDVVSGRVSPPLSVMSRDICHFFLSGDCGAGDQCEFIHESPAPKPRPAVTPQEAPQEAVAPAVGSSWGSGGSSWTGGLSWDPTASSWDPIAPSSAHNPSGGSSWDPPASSNQPAPKSNSSQPKPREVRPNIQSQESTSSSKQSKKKPKSKKPQSKPQEGTPNAPAQDVASLSSSRSSKPSSLPVPPEVAADPTPPSKANSSPPQEGTPKVPALELAGPSVPPVVADPRPPSKANSSPSVPQEGDPEAPARDPPEVSAEPILPSQGNSSPPQERTPKVRARDLAAPSSNLPSSQSTPQEPAASTREPSPSSNQASNTSSAPSPPREATPQVPARDPTTQLPKLPSKPASSQSTPQEAARDPASLSNQASQVFSAPSGLQEAAPTLPSPDPIQSSNQPLKSSSSPSTPREDALSVPTRPTSSSNRPLSHSAPREESPDPASSYNRPSKSVSSRSALREDSASVASWNPAPLSNRSSTPISSHNDTFSVQRDTVTQLTYRPASPSGYLGVSVTQPTYRAGSPAPSYNRPSKSVSSRSALREDSSSVASWNPAPLSNRSSTPISSHNDTFSVQRDTVTQLTYRPASPSGYLGVSTSSRSKSRLREPEPEPEPESEPERDAFDDAETDDGQFDDGQFDDPDDPADYTQRISHPAPAPSFTGRQSYEETSRGYSPTSGGSQPRIYPEVTGPPKPIPYVTDIIPHWSQFADPNADGNKPFCKLLAQNQCMQGEACRFRHALTIDEYVLLFKEQQPNLWTVSRSSGSAPATFQPPPPLPLPPASSLGTPPQPMPAEVASTRSMGRTKRVGLQKITCSFHGLGQCKNGDKCPYAHVGTPPTTNDSSSQGRSSSSVLPASDESWNTTSRSNGSSKTFCRNLEMDGTCKYGDRCHYSHEKPGDGSGWGNDDRQERKAPCRNLDTYGSCKFGDSCRFSHERADDGQAEQMNMNSGGGGSGWNDNGWGDPVNGDDGAAAATTNTNDGWNRSSQQNGDNGWASATSGTGVAQTNPRPCYAFLEGRCNRVCRDYRRGHCERLNCRYSHDLEGSRRENGALDNEWGSHPPESGWTNDGEAKGEDQKDDTGEMVEGNDGRWEPAGSAWADDGLAAEVPNAVDNDDSWSERPNIYPDPQEGDGEGEPQKKIQKPCKEFGQGACQRGDKCRYLHLLPDDQKQYHQEFAEENTNTEGEVPMEEEEEEAEGGHESVEEEGSELATALMDGEEPQVEESETETEDVPDLERFMYHCTVWFNNRCIPDRVMTAVDSRKVELSNLPADTSLDEIRDLVQGIGEVRNLAIMGEAEDFAKVSVEFKEHADAIAAVRLLNDQQFSERPIFARLDSRAQVFARSPLLSQIVMVTWPDATVCAWVFYETVTLAKQAATKLDKTKFQERVIGAEYERRREKRGPYPIRITGMPPGATKADLEGLCQDPAPTLIDIGQPSYTNAPDEDIRRDLEKFGRIEQFRITSEGDPAFKTVAYATMQSFSVADAVSRDLNNTKPAYLGGEAPLRVKHIYHVAYKVAPKVFECIADRLNLLREKYKEKCKIIDSSDGFLHTIEIRASIDESTMFSEANAGLGDLVDGLLLVDDDGRPVWDPYLDTSSSTKAIDRLNNPSSDVPCFVHYDQRLRYVRIYGSLDGQERGKAGVMKILKMVKGQCHEITLQRPKISSLIGNGLETLRNSIGANKVSLDILGGRLIVRGTAEEYEKANLATCLLQGMSAIRLVFYRTT
ncbi:hypothetical protein MD484_g5752, partial [Candolleomyces efflorescens]